MSSIISGKVRLNVRRVDLSSIVQAAVETARPTAEAKGIRLQTVIDPLSLREVIALDLAKSAALAHSRPSRSGLSIFMMKLRQFGITTGLPSLTSDLVITKRMA